MTASPAAPAIFQRAVRTLVGVQPRPELELGEVPPPQRLAPWSYALGAEVDDEAADVSLGTARLVLLHDPDGQDAWDGVLRLVLFLRAELETELAGDPLLPEVGWSWLTEALELTEARWTALGGTVTQTCSARFGDIAGPVRVDNLELRASWTPLGDDLAAHGQAFCAVVSAAVGLPPAGVAVLSQRRSS